MPTKSKNRRFISYLLSNYLIYSQSLAQILTDLIQGEFMQLGSKEGENERFTHYLTKTYRKTASLIANSLKAVSDSQTDSLGLH